MALWAEKGVNIGVHRRPERIGYKAGGLAEVQLQSQENPPVLTPELFVKQASFANLVDISSRRPCGMRMRRQ